MPSKIVTREQCGVGWRPNAGIVDTREMCPVPVQGTVISGTMDGHGLRRLQRQGRLGRRSVQ